ncbi:hypothetical protein KKE19_03700 [Patescibacteria group bacterium]|nr:hypothetical protein [Patescibacteria group bacterium]MBU4274889.1 hypothetical protein [Patescibacteria group bacterium]MBU4367356.1 hypothetical protein [Patescibacteria group bacterium]MBU4461975.1 hypothetical protein [Patescibacteria group bacterium]MCG2699656.1 hypothetical protein [Candidatus Parcubacteria bacterium]
MKDTTNTLGKPKFLVVKLEITNIAPHNAKATVDIPPTSSGQKPATFNAEVRTQIAAKVFQPIISAIEANPSIKTVIRV